jgi:hypothetical protein
MEMVSIMDRRSALRNFHSLQPRGLNFAKCYAPTQHREAVWTHRSISAQTPWNRELGTNK